MQRGYDGKGRSVVLYNMDDPADRASYEESQQAGMALFLLALMVAAFVFVCCTPDYEDRGGIKRGLAVLGGTVCAVILGGMCSGKL